VPAEHQHEKKPLNRSGEGAKLGGDIKNVHNTPDGIQEK
jgi:hypothetical protein